MPVITGSYAFDFEDLRGQAPLMEISEPSSKGMTRVIPQMRIKLYGERLGRGADVLELLALGPANP